MFALIIQTALLLGIAFIIGAILGCLLKRLFGASVETGANRPSQATAANAALGTAVAGTAAIAAAGTAGRAAAAPEASAPAMAPAASVPAPAALLAAVGGTKADASAKAPPSKVSAPKAKPSSSAGAAKAAAPKVKSAEVKAANPAPAKTVKPAAAKPAKAVAAPAASLAAVAPAKPAASAKPKTVKASPAKAPAAKAAKPAAAKAAAIPVAKDDLKRIRGIGRQNEARLNAEGVSAFAQIAGWSSKDQAEWGDRLAFPGRIEREEWVSQAKLLAAGKETEFSKRVAKGEVASSSGKGTVGDLGKKPKVMAAARGGKPDNLTLIDGVGNAIEKKLFDLGIFHFEQIAKWTADESAWVSNAVGFPGRAARENWVADAAKLAKGEMTDHAKRVESGDIATSHKSPAKKPKGKA